MKTTVELQNCDLKIKYMGAETEIYFAKISENLEIMGNLFREELATGFEAVAKAFNSFSKELRGGA
jgi:hypothetical protein